MKIYLLLLPHLLSTLTPLSAEELLKVTEFSHGKSGWQGASTVVHLSAEGEEQPLPSADTTSVLRVKLSNNRWSILEHRVRLSRKQSSASLHLELRTSPDFAPKTESKEYAEEDFAEGGEYGWSARIFTKADLLIQLSENGGWQYRPKAVRASSDWQPITANFKKLKSKTNETLALCFPPGSGFVDIKSVSLDAQ